MIMKRARTPRTFEPPYIISPSAAREAVRNRKRTVIITEAFRKDLVPQSRQNLRKGDLHKIRGRRKSRSGSSEPFAKCLRESSERCCIRCHRNAKCVKRGSQAELSFRRFGWAYQEQVARTQRPPISALPRLMRGPSQIPVVSCHNSLFIPLMSGRSLRSRARTARPTALPA
jgi:hypothetical protein